MSAEFDSDDDDVILSAGLALEVTTTLQKHGPGDADTSYVLYIPKFMQNMSKFLKIKNKNKLPKIWSNRPRKVRLS